MPKLNLLGIQTELVEVDQNNPYMIEASRVMKRAMKSRKVIPKEDGTWLVTRFLTKKSDKIFQNQDDAVKYAEKLASRYEASVFIYDKDREIIDRKDFW